MQKDEEQLLEEDIKKFLKEKEKIRSILGKIGGKVTFVNKMMNLFWAIIVTGVLVIAVFVEDKLRFAMMDIGILLISLKIVYYFHCQAKVSHFQFWILSSIEWRVNEMINKLNELAKKAEK
ncbi:MAG: hypothetical protein ACE5D6_10000 [Candidatus Zixiibacteriota bacterium]